MTETIIPLNVVLLWADEYGLVCGSAPDAIENIASQRACPRCAGKMRAEGFYEAGVCVAWFVLCPSCWIAIDNMMMK